MDVAQIGEDMVCIGHVLIDVVEVADEQLPPAEEFVESLLRACKLTEGLIKVADQFDRVGDVGLRLLTEEFADGDIGRTPEGLPLRQTGQVLVEEQRGTLVREHHRCARQVGAVFADDVFCDVF